MRYPFAATVAVVAFISAPIVSQAATTHHHKLHHAGSHASVRNAHGMMNEPRGVTGWPADYCDTINVGNFEMCAPESLKNNSS